MDFQNLEHIYIPSGNPEAATLLLLHGTGGDERDLLPFAKYFDGLNILSVRGNVLENGMPRFFKRIGMGIFDEKDLEFRTEELVAFLKKISEEKNFDVSKIIALGYSNGANIAGAVLNRHPNFLAGAVLFRAMLPFQQGAFQKNDGNTPVFLSSGTNDPTVNVAETHKYISLLEDAGFAITHYDLPTGHNLTQQDLDLAAKWFKDNF